MPFGVGASNFDINNGLYTSVRGDMITIEHHDNRTGGHNFMGPTSTLPPKRNDTYSGSFNGGNFSGNGTGGNGYQTDSHFPRGKNNGYGTGSPESHGGSSKQSKKTSESKIYNGGCFGGRDKDTYSGNKLNFGNGYRYYEYSKKNEDGSSELFSGYVKTKGGNFMFSESTGKLEREDHSESDSSSSECTFSGSSDEGSFSGTYEDQHIPAGSSTVGRQEIYSGKCTGCNFGGNRKGGHGRQSSVNESNKVSDTKPASGDDNGESSGEEEYLREAIRRAKEKRRMAGLNEEL